MAVHHPGKPASAPRFAMAAILPTLALLAGCTQSFASPTGARKIACSIASLIPTSVERAGKTFGDEAIVLNLKQAPRGNGAKRARRARGFSADKRGSGPKTSFVGPTSAYLAGEVK